MLCMIDKTAKHAYMPLTGVHTELLLALASYYFHLSLSDASCSHPSRNKNECLLQGLSDALCFEISMHR